MRLVRTGAPGAEKPGALVDDNLLVDLSDVVADYNEAFFGSGRIATLAPLIAERVASAKPSPWVTDASAHPSPGRTKSCASASTTETMRQKPGRPSRPNRSCSTRRPNTLIGPNDDVLIPSGSVKTDWEVELGVVIGKRCLYLADEAEAAGRHRRLRARQRHKRA